jgi:diguanylate cyclase (GGDEF)-like protein/PAS domain S-box-containing protein
VKTVHPLNAKLAEIKASGTLPSPQGIALQVMRLLQQDEVSNQQIANVIKADPVMSGRILQAANALLTYQIRPIVSVVDAVTVLGFNTVNQLLLSLSLMDSHQSGRCKKFDYHQFWTHSLLCAISAQNLVRQSGIGSPEEVFVLGLLSKVGSLALATAYPERYERILDQQATESELTQIEQLEFGFNHNQLSQAMLADWGMPALFQDITLHHEAPSFSEVVEGSRAWHLLNVIHVADYFAALCLAKEPQRRKMIPKLILIAARLGIEMNMLAQLGDQSLAELQTWSDLCAIKGAALDSFSGLLEAVPLVPEMFDLAETTSGRASAFYKLRILLVDDERVNLLLLQSLLEQAGHTVLTSANGAEALSKLEEFKPQLIITDWLMPEMNGIQFCQALRQQVEWRTIYVLIMTAQQGMEMLVEAFEAGANDYITKPISNKVLLARLRAAQRVVQLQEEMESDRQQLHQFSAELASFNLRLRKSDVSMRAILNNSPYMSWLKDAEGKYVNINKAYADYLCPQKMQQIIGKTDFDLISPTLAQQYSSVDAEVMATRQQTRIEESFKVGEQTHWVETFKTPVIDENGKVLGTTGFARDITERKLEEAEVKIAATAFESLQGIMITDVEGVVLRVNNSFSAITGYSSAEMIGKTPRILSSGRHDANFYVSMWESIRRTGSWEGEIWNRRKNGEIYPEYLTITAVKDQNNSVVHYVSTLADITLSREAADEIKHLAFYDLLTRLPNRRLLVDRLQQALAASERSGKLGALLFIDLDNFKVLNETLGHDFGDLLLQQVAQRLESSLRQGDTVARMGGDEFVVMLEGLSELALDSARQTEAVAEQIFSSLNQPYRLAAHEYHNTASIGATLFKGSDCGIDDLFKQADIAMYHAKNAGRNTLRFFDPQMQEKINQRVTLEAELSKALELNQFELYYQIQVDENARPTGAETLIRWIHPERGMVSPVQFIPLAEETGLILPIGHWVLETACARLKIWAQNPLTRELILSVNVSAKQFRQPDFVAQVQSLVQRYAINPNRLKLELTESMLLDNVDAMIVTMNALNKQGIRFSLDDFGTGYSSLQYLKRLPLNQLKIDQSFVRDLVEDNSDKAIVCTIIAMAHSLNLHVIAEGVETEQQRQFLQQSGCNHYQGYLFSKPVTIQAFERLLTDGGFDSLNYLRN